MNNPKIALGLALLACGSVLLMGAAQDTDQSDLATRYVTGCLQRGPNANEYQLIAEDAKWRLESDNVRLLKTDNVKFDDHIGQKVKVAGMVSNQPFHGIKEDLKGAVEKNPTETGILIVTNLDIVSNRCN